MVVGGSGAAGLEDDAEANGFGGCGVVAQNKTPARHCNLEWRGGGSEPRSAALFLLRGSV